MSYIEYFEQYLPERLGHYEALDLDALGERELTAVGGEASAIKKFMLYALEEGYEQELRFVLEPPISTLLRLDRFVPEVMRQLGTASERERFYLFPQEVRVPLKGPEEAPGGEVFELEEYLAGLLERSARPVDVGPCFDDDNMRRLWQAKTRVLMEEMAGFCLWLVERILERPGLVPVPLLRDALLPHLALSILQQSGVALPAPRPLLFSRKLVARFQDPAAGRDALYLELAHVLYRVLLDRRPGDPRALYRAFADRVRESPAIPAALFEASHRLLDALDLDGPPLFLETGVQGTFPLWLLAVANAGDSTGAGDLALYTTAPWLYEVYDGVVYRKHHQYLYDRETVAAHDRLFQLEDEDGPGGRILVRETADETTRRLALYELHAFQQIVGGGSGEPAEAP